MPLPWPEPEPAPEWSRAVPWANMAGSHGSATKIALNNGCATIYDVARTISRATSVCECMWGYAWLAVRTESLTHTPPSARLPFWCKCIWKSCIWIVAPLPQDEQTNGLGWLTKCHANYLALIFPKKDNEHFCICGPCLRLSCHKIAH